MNDKRMTAAQYEMAKRKILKEFPALEIALQAGVISTRMIREMLGVDRWFWNEVQKQLILAGAIKGVNTSSFKASDEMLAYLKERKEHTT